MKETTTNKIHFENLDGLRFIAFFLVFIAHSFYSEVGFILSDEIYQFITMAKRKGTLGVNFFFVLSGFLITYLLLAEQNLKNTINILLFYSRRILRIWPLFYAVVFVGFVVIPFVMQTVFGEKDYVEKATIWYYIFFINNFDRDPSSAVLGVLWSLAIEEQFYLFWPIFFKLTPKKYQINIFFIVIIGSLFWRIGVSTANAHTLVAISDMAVGGLAAYFAFYNYPIIQIIKQLSKLSIYIVYVLGFAVILTSAFWLPLHPYCLPFERLIYSLFFAFIILEQNYASQSIYKMSSSKFMSFWGIYTYGLYCLHFMAIYIVSRIFRTYVSPSFWHTYLSEPIVSLMLSLLFAYSSYHLFEKPFLTIKKRFSISA